MSFPNLSALAVRERAITLFFILLSVIAGVYAFLSLGRAEDPAFTIRALVVSAVWPGATAEEMQDQVVNRLEKRIQEVEYLYRLETSVRPGRADIIVEFHDYSPSKKVPDLLYQVRKRMQDEAPRLPRGVIGPIVNDDFSDVYFTLVALTARGMPMRELSREAEAIRDRLQRIPGVQKAVLIGERTERVFIDFDTAKLLSLGISPEAVLDAIDANNRLLPAGLIETNGPRIYLRLDNTLENAQQLESVPIRIGNKLLKLGDIAQIRTGYEDPPTYMIRSRGEDAILLGVVMQQGENGLKLGEQLQAFFEKERKRMPLGLEMTQLTNQANAIKAAVNLFQVKFLAAVAVVMAVSILAIGFRAGLVVGIAIPITLGLTFLLMKITGINLDRITLGALIISLGLLVDDAIISIEMMIVKMEQGWSRLSAAAHAWNVTAAPMLFGTLVTVSGFVPIGFAQSGVGEYAGNIFWVLAFSLLVSWLVAVTFTPYLGVKLLPDYKHAQGGHHDPYRTPAYEKLRSLVTWCVTHRKTVVSSTVLLLILSIMGMAGPVQKQFFPTSDRTEVLVSIYLPQGGSVTSTNQTTQKVEKILAAMPEVNTLSAYIGAGAPRFFISSNPEQPDPAFAKLIAVTHSKKDRDTVIQKLRQQIDQGAFPEARIRVTSLLYGPPVIWPVSFRVVGPDVNELRRIAHQVRDIMQSHPNIRDANLEWDERAPTLRLDMDPDRLRLIGLTPRDIAQQLQFQLDGLPITELRQDIRTVEVRARGARGDTLLPEQLEFKTQDGRKIPLSQLGNIEVHYEDPVIRRYNRQPAISVRADVEGAQAPDVSWQVWKSLEQLRQQLPQDYELEIGGSVEQSGKADASIQKLQPLMVGLMLIFIMLQMRSFSGTFMVVATAPLGLIGAVLSLLLFNQPFGFVALLGLIGLAGILMRNTLILTQQVNDNIDEGLDIKTSVIEAAVQRARPVMLTALAAAFAFIPLTWDSFWGPLAYVLIGGVAVGTVITILFVPALYALWFRIGRQPQGGAGVK